MPPNGEQPMETPAPEQPLEACSWASLCSFSIENDIGVSLVQNDQTGLRVCFIDIPGPLVKGYFVLATEAVTNEYAHADDGLPHTLEHLIFLGSEQYPYKGVLDQLANRCLAQGTNAWTDVDHTAYTLTTAGSEGFVRLLPIYLDHILFPTLTDAAFHTEVHHITEDGEDNGVVYSEMQARENTCFELASRRMMSLLFPGTGYASYTGGSMQNLRTLTNEKIKRYHQEYYRPDNLCLIIAGAVDHQTVLGDLEPMVRKCRDREDKHKTEKHKRPWSTPVERLLPGGARVERVFFPSEDESTGEVLLAWRATKWSEFASMTALNVLLMYLTDSPIAPIKRAFVETEDPICSDVSYSLLEGSTNAFYIRFMDVKRERIEQVLPKFYEVLLDVCQGVDIVRIRSLIKRTILRHKSDLESDPHRLIAFDAIVMHLYGSREPGVEALQMKERIGNVIGRLESLPQTDQYGWYWAKLVKEKLADKGSPPVAVLAVPSAKLAESMAEAEEARIAGQSQMLGDSGLKRLGDKLRACHEINSVACPDSVIETIPIPDSTEVPLLPVTGLRTEPRDGEQIHVVPYRNRYSSEEALELLKAHCQALADSVGLECLMQLDQVNSQFIEVSVILNCSGLKDEQRYFLPLLSSCLLELPVINMDGSLTSHDEVIERLAEDTISSHVELSMSGYTFSPGIFPDALKLTLKLEQGKLEEGVKWLSKILFATVFSPERLRVVANRLLASIANYKRSGGDVCEALSKEVTFREKSPHVASTFLWQEGFLTYIASALESNADEIVAQMEEIRYRLTQIANIKIHCAGDWHKIPEPLRIFKANLQLGHPAILPSAVLPPSSIYRSEVILRKRRQYAGFSRQLMHLFPKASIVGLNSIESSFLSQFCEGPDTFDHPDVPPLLITIQYLTALEGDFWRTIRGLGLAYHYQIDLQVEQGMLFFHLFNSTDLEGAYREAREIIRRYQEGELEVDHRRLEAAKSCEAFSYISRDENVSSSAFYSFLNYLKGTGPDYHSVMLGKLQAVTAADVKRMLETYLRHLFDPTLSSVIVVTPTIKVQPLKVAFAAWGRELVDGALERPYEPKKDEERSMREDSPTQRPIKIEEKQSNVTPLSSPGYAWLVPSLAVGVVAVAIGAWLYTRRSSSQ